MVILQCFLWFLKKFTNQFISPNFSFAYYPSVYFPKSIISKCFHFFPFSVSVFAFLYAFQLHYGNEGAFPGESWAQLLTYWLIIVVQRLFHKINYGTLTLESMFLQLFEFVKKISRKNDGIISKQLPVDIILFKCVCSQKRALAELNELLQEAWSQHESCQWIQWKGL